MNLKNIPAPVYYIAGMAAAVGFLYWVIKNIDLKKTAAAGVGAVADVSAGLVLGAGDVFGLPRTELSECEKAKAEGRTWDASFACTAPDFLSYVFGSAPADKPAAASSSANPNLDGERTEYVTRNP